jgi:PAS domain S-box-containing protein
MAQADPITRRFLKVNHAVCALTGYSEDELLAMTVDDLNHPDDREQDRALFENLAGGEGQYDIEKRYVGKDGRPVWVQVTGNILRDQGGRPLHAFAVIQDKFVNRAYREFFNTSEEQLHSPPSWHQFVHPEDLPSVVERFATAVRDHVDLVAECRVRHADGTWRWIMSHGAPRFAADGTFLGHVGSSPDVTLLKRTDQALRLKEAHLSLLSDTVLLRGSRPPLSQL